MAEPATACRRRPQGDGDAQPGERPVVARQRARQHLVCAVAEALRKAVVRVVGAEGGIDAVHRRGHAGRAPVVGRQRGAGGVARHARRFLARVPAPHRQRAARGVAGESRAIDAVERDGIGVDHGDLVHLVV